MLVSCTVSAGLMQHSGFESDTIAVSSTLLRELCRCLDVCCFWNTSSTLAMLKPLPASMAIVSA